jgi:hypothetical protein
MKTSRASALSLLAALILPPLVLAVDPPPAGGYPNENTALGDNALFSLVSGSTGLNTAVGFEALYGTTTGSNNTGLGDHVLHNNTTGGANTGVGFDALYQNTTGTYCVAVGVDAMVANTTGGGSVGVGYTALSSNTTGYDNVAVGFGAMAFSTSGGYNTALGRSVMAFNTTGSENTAIGDAAMNQSSGSSNIAIGPSAGLNLAGSNNIVIGQYGGQNLTKGSNNIEIGHEGAKKDDALIRIGTPGTQKQTFVAGISGSTVADGVAVMVNNKGQLGVATSSVRFKDDIQPMKDASDVLLSLQPVTFRYKKELDSLGTPQFGLVAEQVAKVDPDLVARDDSGKPYTVRYEAVNAMLLNEFLKEHRKVEALEEKVALLAATVEKQSTLIEKGSAVRSSTRLVSTNE